jgi:hypothetical protein
LNHARGTDWEDPTVSLTPDEILATELKKLAVKATDKEVGAGVVAWVARKMPNDACTIPLSFAATPEEVLRTALDVLEGEGRLRDDVADASEAPTVAAVVGSGFLGLNPALVTVEVVPSAPDGAEVTVSGTAKEGLIKQRGGQKAAQRVAELLKGRLAS